MKKHASVFVFLLIFTMMFGSVCVTAYNEADYSSRNTVRVGLVYGSSAVPAANAYASDGYRLGYYDDSNAFVCTAQISNTFITASKDSTVYVDGSTVSESASASAVRFGAYHLQLAESFSSFHEASAFADTVRSALTAAGIDIEVFPAEYDAAYYVRIEHYSALDYAKADIDRLSPIVGSALTAVGSSTRGITFIDMNSPRIICEIEFSDKWVAAVPTEGYIKNGSYYYAGGFEYKRLDGGNITFINVVGLEDYLEGVLPYEMSSSYPIEALRAQAICARCYYLGSYNKHASYGFNVCATTNCQVYRGVGSVTDSIRQAVESTRGQILVYGDTLVTTYFYSSNGGYSEDNSNVWGGTQYPYYTAVPDTFEELTVSNYGKWSTTVSKSSLNTLAQKYGLADMADIYVSQRTSAGNVYEITMVDSTGKQYTISQCDRVRSALSSYVKSARFTITTDATIKINDKTTSESIYGMSVIGSGGEVSTVTSGGTVYVMTGSGKEALGGGSSCTFSGTGWGHSVGMSQLGAKGRANAGWSGEDIVKYYFTGTEIVTNSTLKG